MHNSSSANLNLAHLIPLQWALQKTLLLPAMKEGFTSALNWGSTEQVEERTQGSWELFIDW